MNLNPRQVVFAYQDNEDLRAGVLQLLMESCGKYQLFPLAQWTSNSGHVEWHLYRVAIAAESFVKMQQKKKQIPMLYLHSGPEVTELFAGGGHEMLIFGKGTKLLVKTRMDYRKKEANVLQEIPPLSMGSSSEDEVLEFPRRYTYSTMLQFWLKRTEGDPTSVIHDAAGQNLPDIYMLPKQPV